MTELKLPEISEKLNLSHDEIISEYRYLENLEPSDFGCPHGFAQWFENIIEQRKKHLCWMLMLIFVPLKERAHDKRHKLSNNNELLYKD